MRGFRSLQGQCPKRDKKAKNTIINNNERHIIHHNINKAEKTKETGKQNRLMGPGLVSKSNKNHSNTQSTEMRES
jgi:hypothetical protein